MFWQSLKWDSEDDSVAFYEKLQEIARDYFAKVRFGSAVISTASGNRSVGLMVDRRFSLVEAAELLNQLLRLYSEASTNLVAAGTSSPTDDQIFGEGLGLLDPITETYNDFSQLRTGPCSPASQSSGSIGGWRIVNGRLYERDPNGGATPWRELIPTLQDGQVTFAISTTGVA